MMYMKKPWRQVLYAMVFIHDNRILAKRGFYCLCTREEPPRADYNLL